MTDKEKKRYEDYKLACAALMLCYPFMLEDLDGEIWRDIKGFEGHYQISNYGRVKSFKTGEVKILKPHVDKDGYLQICFCDNGKHKWFKIHCLVAMAFIPNPENKETVNHIDGCKMNNFVGNLEWNSSRENTRHAVNTGLMKSGVDSYRAKLNREQVIWCRKMYTQNDKKFGVSALAEICGISRRTMHDVVTGKTYKNVK